MRVSRVLVLIGVGAAAGAMFHYWVYPSFVDEVGVAVVAMLVVHLYPRLKRR
ncbi:MAG: hypothetical protein KBC81_03685 [Candidatus Pacebacteria bacterium]|nr:hypothetical protein [Candidatus Paceibacterota bacterium]